MTAFSETVKSEIQQILGSARTAPWDFQLVGANECRVDANGVRLFFFSDDRESSIATSVMFVNEEEWSEDRVYIESISSLIEGYGYHLDTLETYRDKISKDIKAIGIFLELLDSEKITPRDAVFYDLGYNAGRDMRYRAARRLD